MVKEDREDAQSSESEIKFFPKSLTAPDKNQPSCFDSSPLNAGFNIVLPTPTLGHISAPVSGPITTKSNSFHGPSSPEKSGQNLANLGSFPKMDNERNMGDRDQAQEDFPEPIWSTNSFNSEKVQSEKKIIRKTRLSKSSRKLEKIQEPMGEITEPS
jgi:hypothetical protein